jgi:GTP:adenosylcobinamide-phosphate guanylyltransferase
MPLDQQPALIGGVPMLVRVVRTVHAARDVGRILVAIDDPAVLDDLPELGALAGAGVLRLVRCARSPSATVLECLESLPAWQPVLVTAADHPLLATEMVDYFCAATRSGDADVVVGAVSARVLRGRYPESRRTLIRLRNEAFSGANLFAFITPRATTAAAFWMRAEAFRKRPWRLVSLFGAATLALFVLRRLDLASAVARASRIIGARISVVQMPFPECAIDVDGPADLALASRILRDRDGAVSGGGQPLPDGLSGMPS